MVGRRGPRGPSAGGRARRRPPRARARARALGRPLSRRAGRVGVTGRGLVGLSPVRALGTLTSWGDGEWVVVGPGLPGIAVAALRSPTGAAGCTSGAARGGRCASCGVGFGARRPRPFVVGVSAWSTEQDVGTAVCSTVRGAHPSAVWGGGHVVAVGCSSPHLAVPLCAAGTPPSGSKISDTAPDRESGPGGCAADGSPGVNAALGRGTTAGASSGARHRRAGGRSPPTGGVGGWAGCRSTSTTAAAPAEANQPGEHEQDEAAGQPSAAVMTRQQ